MLTYALSVKYSAETLAAIRAAGYSSRDEAAQSFYEQLGGKMVGHELHADADVAIPGALALQDSSEILTAAPPTAHQPHPPVH